MSNHTGFEPQTTAFEKQVFKQIHVPRLSAAWRLEMDRHMDLFAHLLMQKVSITCFNIFSSRGVLHCPPS